MTDPTKVNAFATIEVFIRFEGWLPRAGLARRVERHVVSDDTVAPNRDRGSIRDEDAFEVGVLNRKSSHHNLAEAGIIEAIDINAIRLALCVDDRVGAAGTD